MILNNTITIPSINCTTDYSTFKFHPLNRPVNETHVKSLIESMKQDYLFTLITVNEKNEICDGQHRYYAIRELNLPLFYVVIPGVYQLNSAGQQLPFSSKPHIFFWVGNRYCYNDNNKTSGSQWWLFGGIAVHKASESFDHDIWKEEHDKH